jgi:hypothetical protein
MTVGDLKELLKSNLLEDRNQLFFAFPSGDDEEFKGLTDCQIEMHASGRVIVFRSQAEGHL